nr:MAG TPA: hypothetical protein [Caudoviricetes sp.]
MEIRNILMMVLLSFMPSTTIKAQFNTVGRLYNQQVMGHRTKRILRIERKEYQTY